MQHNEKTEVTDHPLNLKAGGGGGAMGFFGVNIFFRFTDFEVREIMIELSFYIGYWIVQLEGENII